PRLFNREESRLFKRSHLQRAETFYEKHGGKTIVLARFLPIVRTFAPTVAGAANMAYPRFAFYNVFGATIWVFSTVLLGYYVGESVPNPDLLFPVLVGIIFVLSIAPAAIHLLRERSRAAPES
ncbi:MAG: DedA family protein, partial [Anaerolineales bacterium]